METTVEDRSAHLDRLICCRMHVPAEMGRHLVSERSETADRDLQERAVQQRQVPAQRGRQVPPRGPVSITRLSNASLIVGISRREWRS